MKPIKFLLRHIINECKNISTEIKMLLFSMITAIINVCSIKYTFDYLYDIYDCSDKNDIICDPMTIALFILGIYFSICGNFLILLESNDKKYTLIKIIGGYYWFYVVPWLFRSLFVFEYNQTVIGNYLISFYTFFLMHFILFLIICLYAYCKDVLNKYQH